MWQRILIAPALLCGVLPVLMDSPATPSVSRVPDAPDQVEGVPMNDPLMGLPWHESLDEAVAESSRTGKPILSLRMLGRLDEELSCANSRFYRTVLYANHEVRKLMTERFVLHWSSERDVPVLTIDFGDGRKLVRTITGNSAHYVFDTRGRVVDVIPGVHGAPGFMSLLLKAESLALETSSLDDLGRAEILERRHQESLDELDREWTAFQDEVPAGSLPKTPWASEPRLEEAMSAQWRTMSKAIVEWPAARAITVSRQAPDRRTSEPGWEQLALARSGQGHLDTPSQALFLRKHFSQVPAGKGAGADDAREQGLPQGPIDATEVLRAFELLVVQDGLRNEQLLHRRVHEWFARRADLRDFVTVNRRVYDELFLTPAADPWLGLNDPGVYIALDASMVP